MRFILTFGLAIGVSLTAIELHAKGGELKICEVKLTGHPGNNQYCDSSPPYTCYEESDDTIGWSVVIDDGMSSRTLKTYPYGDDGKAQAQTAVNKLVASGACIEL